MTAATEKDWTKTMTTAASAIYGAVSYTDKKHLTLVDVMGLTGHAFRLNIDPKQIHAAGPTSFPGGYILRRNLANLGFISNLADAEMPVTPELAERTIALVQQAIDRGTPAIAFDLFIPEFGLIYGYDDERQLFHAKDVSHDGTISYRQFVESKIGVLFAVTIAESLPHSKYEMLRMALDMIVSHARGEEWNHVFKDKFAMGLSGYGAWIDVMRKREADAFGNAYNVEVVADARAFAAEFLRRLTVQWNGANIVERMVRERAAEAAAHYEAVAEAFRGMESLFPFPQGGTPQDAEIADRAVVLLADAQAAEEKGVKVLEQLFDFMKAYYSEVWVH
ncbi:hypothetical protein [Cohnella nanjingensis]|uniref:Uncharacterized protein n=1 Tax=Cohnella nanjingensis TaxID=1387779 RepID=A0A7X0RSB6_9BACL|nr:hypothetical protein [Cohnella nanjingensis]MBB6671344.1 hypothetical protein [Cohnella nanjingensis]